jgi:hypothetical protein
VNDTVREILKSELELLTTDLDALNAKISGYELALERDRQRAADMMTRIVDINEALGNPLLTVPVPA